MQGLFKRKGSDIYQGRFRIPSPLWRERNRLIGLGVKDIPKTQEHGRSTGKSDRDEAGEAYRAMLVAWDAKMAAWEKVLADGPMPLTPKQQMALAADHARAFVAAYDEDPYSAPPSPPVPQPSLGDDAHWIAMAEKMPPSERQRFMRDLRAYLKSQDEKRRSSLAFKLLDRYPDIRPFIAPHLASLLEAAHGDDTDKAVASKALHIDAEARRLVNLEMLSFMGAAHRGLEAKRGGNYNPVPELEAAPAFVPPAKTSTASSKADPQFTFRSIVAAETARRALGKDAKPFPASTPRKYLKRGEEFASWRQSQGLSKSAALDARTVTREEVERWRASLLAGSELTNRTINDKVSCISTIIKWGRRLHREAFHPEGNPLAGLEKLDFKVLDSDARTYRIDEAVAVLRAARKETEVRRRWLPWLCAYSGMRIEEAGQLTAEDFFQVGERWFLRVSTSGRRSLKTASSQRRIPIHPSLEAEGLLDFVRKVGKGRLFKSNRIQPLMSEWVRDTVGIKRPELSPNHGWRHFFEDLCALANMSDAARDFMTGRASGKSRDQYGRSELMLPGLAKAMDKIPDIIGLLMAEAEGGDQV